MVTSTKFIATIQPTFTFLVYLNKFIVQLSQGLCGFSISNFHCENSIKLRHEATRAESLTDQTETSKNLPSTRHFLGQIPFYLSMENLGKIIISSSHGNFHGDLGKQG